MASQALKFVTPAIIWGDRGTINLFSDKTAVLRIKARKQPGFLGQSQNSAEVGWAIPGVQAGTLGKRDEQQNRHFLPLKDDFSP